MRERASLLFSLAVCLILLSGCGGSGGTQPPPPLPKPDFLYALTPPGPVAGASFQISTYKVDTSTGALTSSGSTSLSGLVVPQIAVDPASAFLYMSFPNPVGNAIGIFSIDPRTGVPTQTSAFSVTQLCAFCPPISGPGVLSMDSSGKFMFYGSSTLGSGVFQGIGALAIDGATGNLSGVNGSPFPGDDAPFFVRVHPSGKFLYTENIDPTGAGGVSLQSISGFNIDPNTGALTSSVLGSPYPPPINSSIGGLAIHPSGKFIYATTGFAQNGIMGWSVDAAGGLTPLPSSPFQPGTSAFGVGAFDPSGNFFYVAAAAQGGISGFSVDAGGNLTPLPSSPFGAGSSFASPAIDPAGKFLFAGDTLNKTILVFSLDPNNGALTAVGSPVQVGVPAFVLTVVSAP